MTEKFLVPKDIRLVRGQRVTIRGVLHIVEKVNNKSSKLVLVLAPRNERLAFTWKRRWNQTKALIQGWIRIAHGWALWSRR
jgi:hypothetical protein